MTDCRVSHFCTLRIASHSSITIKGGIRRPRLLYDRALEEFEKKLGRDNKLTLSIMNNLPNLYDHQGQLKKAQAMYDRTLAGKKNHLDRITA
jgi:tetratricopeptide (TPR) repeat protein